MEEFTYKYILAENARLRKIWGSTKYTLDQIDTAVHTWFWLCGKVPNLSQDEQAEVNLLVESTMTEWATRSSYMLFNPRVIKDTQERQNGQA